MYDIVYIAQCVAIALLFFETLYIALQQPSQTQRELMLTTLATAFVMIGYLIEISARSVETAMVGVVVGYIGKPFALLASLLFVASFCGRRIPRKLVITLSLIAVAFPVLIATNGSHHLYYSSVKFMPGQGLSALVLEHGPFYYVYIAATVAYLCVNVMFSIRELKNSETHEERVHVLWIIGMVASAMAGFAIFLTGITAGYDSTQAGCFLGTVFLFLLFYKGKLFNLLSVAKDQALMEAHNGLLVIDKRDKVIYENNMIRDLLRHTIGIEDILALPERQTVLSRGDRTFSIRKKNVIRDGRICGAIVEVIDITDSYAYSLRLKSEVENRVQELRHMQRSIIASFSNIVEARDPNTGDHIKSTGALVQAIADELRTDGAYPDILTEQYEQYLIDAAPLHDIGKLSIPDSVLLKPGRLTNEEFEIIKTHTDSGMAIIEQTMRGIENDDYVNMAKDVARYHHEKWDGSGYPTGIGGEDIPLCARIVAVADVYDAVRSVRCYKQAINKYNACQIIRDGSGKHFDPKIVAAFLKCVDSVDP